MPLSFLFLSLSSLNQKVKLLTDTNGVCVPRIEELGIFSLLSHDSTRYIYDVCQYRKSLTNNQGRNTLRNRNEAARERNLPMLWPVWQSGAALKPIVVVLTNLKGHVTSFRVVVVGWEDGSTERSSCSMVVQCLF